MLVLLGGVAKIYPNLSDGAKKYQQAFLVLLPGLDSISILGDCAKKYQQYNLIPNEWDMQRKEGSYHFIYLAVIIMMVEILHMGDRDKPHPLTCKISQPKMF